MRHLGLFESTASAKSYIKLISPCATVVKENDNKRFLYYHSNTIDEKLVVAGDTFNELELEKAQTSEIRYISTNAVTINPSAFDSPIKSHTYDENTHEGVITFSGVLTTIDGQQRITNYSSDESKITELTIPHTVTSFGSSADLTMFYNSRDYYGYPLTIKVEHDDGTYSSYSAYVGNGEYYLYLTLNNNTEWYSRILVYNEAKCIAKNTPITLADGSTKPVQDIDYDDDLLVWDFDLGQYSSSKPLWIKVKETASYYFLCKFENGDELKLIGPESISHRLFDCTLQSFEYPQNIVGDEVFTENGVTRLISCERIDDTIEHYNIITYYHMNLFANHFLTSCRYSNVYPILNMKYVKDEREIIPIEMYKGIPEKWYHGLRLGEQTTDIEKTITYIETLLPAEKNEKF